MYFLPPLLPCPEQWVPHLSGNQKWRFNCHLKWGKPYKNPLQNCWCPLSFSSTAQGGTHFLPPLSYGPGQGSYTASAAAGVDLNVDYTTEIAPFLGTRLVSGWNTLECHIFLFDIIKAVLVEIRKRNALQEEGMYVGNSSRDLCFGHPGIMSSCHLVIWCTPTAPSGSLRHPATVPRKGVSDSWRLSAFLCPHHDLQLSRYAILHERRAWWPYNAWFIKMK